MASSNIAGLFRSIYGGNIGRQAAALEAARNAQQVQLQKLEMEMRNQQLENQGIANTNAIIQNATSGIVGGIGSYQEGQRQAERFALEKQAAQNRLAEEERQRKDALAAAAADVAASRILDTVAQPAKPEAQLVGPTGQYELPTSKPLRQWMVPLEQYRETPKAPENTNTAKPTSVMVDEMMGSLLSQQKNTKFSAEDQQRARGILSARIAKAKMDSTTVQLGEAEKRSNLNKLRFSAIDDALDSSIKPNGKVDDAVQAATGVYEELSQSIPGLKEKDVVERAKALWTIKEQKYRAAEQDIKTKEAQASNYLEVNQPRTAVDRSRQEQRMATTKLITSLQKERDALIALNRQGGRVVMSADDKVKLAEYNRQIEEAQQDLKRYTSDTPSGSASQLPPSGTSNSSEGPAVETPAVKEVVEPPVKAEVQPPAKPAGPPAKRNQPVPPKAPATPTPPAAVTIIDVKRKAKELMKAEGITQQDVADDPALPNAYMAKARRALGVE